MRRIVKNLRDNALERVPAPSPVDRSAVAYLDAYSRHFAGQAAIEEPGYWRNDSHLNARGYERWASWVVGEVQALNVDEPVAWVGDSWGNASREWIPWEVQAVPGRRLLDMLPTVRRVAKARPAAVVLQYGVNEIVTARPVDAVLADTDKAVGMVQASGARVVVVGNPPLSSHIAEAARLNEVLRSHLA